MAIIDEPNRSKLYTKVRHLLGAPLRSVELEGQLRRIEMLPGPPILSPVR